LAVNIDDIAMPLALVVTVSLFIKVELKVPLAPVAGAVKVTNAPLTGDPPMVTVATSGLAKVVFTAALCDDPLVAAIVSVGAVKFELLQSVKITKQRKIKPRMPA
jgi:hypothetical protein